MFGKKRSQEDLSQAKAYKKQLKDILIKEKLEQLKQGSDNQWKI